MPAAPPFPERSGAAGAIVARLLGLALLAAPAQGAFAAPAKHEVPVPAATVALMAARDASPSAPILMRAFKKEAELEVWKQTRSGRYVHLKTFPICRWSGQLGPKRRTGDRQTPEGFYAVPASKMNPNSSYHLSFDLGYPNAYDRAHGGTGSHLMVHGTCSSMGCFAMTDAGVSEIYALARDALAGGQRAFQVQSYPFRMTAANMARYRNDPNIAFWRQLKEGFDRFEATGDEPAVTVTGGRYVFAPFRSPDKEALVAARRATEETRLAALLADGPAAWRTTYSDGGQHPTFAALIRRGGFVGEVSRPEALVLAGREVLVTPARPKVMLAAAVKPAKPSDAAWPKEEPSVFGPRPLGLPPEAAPAVIAGAARIRPAAFTPAPIEIASR